MSHAARRWADHWPVPAVIVAGLAGCAYFETFLWMLGRWRAPSSYYSHGFLVPLVTLFLIWRKRDALRAEPIGSSRMGMGLLVAGLLVHAAASVLRIHFISGFSFLAVVIGACLYLFGGRAVRQIAFPLAFLVFMIPLPMVAIAGLSLRLKLFAAACAMKIVSAAGIAAVREGSVIHFTTCSLTVGDVCSGLRSLIAMLSLGAVYGYVRGMDWPRHLVLFLSSVPIAVAANVVRIVGLCIVGNFWGADAATGIVHDISGMLLFALALLMLFGVEKVLMLYGSPEEVAE